MSKKQAKAIRKHIRDNHNVLVEARWRRPFRWLPGLHNWKPIILFPKFQFLFTFRMLHEINMNVQGTETGRFSSAKSNMKQVDRLIVEEDCADAEVRVDAPDYSVECNRKHESGGWCTYEGKCQAKHRVHDKGPRGGMTRTNHFMCQEAL